MFSLQNSSGTLSYRLTATGATQMRIDDIRLTDGEPSEQIIVFDNTVYPLAELPAYENDDYVITHYGTLGSQRVRNYTMLFDKEKTRRFVGLPTRSIHVIGETAEEPRLGRQTLSSKCYIRPKFMEKHSAIIKTIHAASNTFGRPYGNRRTEQPNILCLEYDTPKRRFQRRVGLLSKGKFEKICAKTLYT